jgi:dolichol-phosphate mannosyltransferase
MKTLARLQEHALALRPFLGKFAIVGLLGVAVNQGCLLLLVAVAGLQVRWAGAIAIELAILTTFFLNNSWTWKDRRRRSFISRFMLYHLVTLLSGICNYVILLFLHAEGMHYGIANLFGMGVAGVLNFSVHYYWTFDY